MKEQFKIKLSGFKEIRRKALLISIPLILISSCAGLFIFHFNETGKPSEINIYPIMIPLILIIIAYGLNRGMKQQQKIFNSYVLTIDEGYIIREQLNTPTISIAFYEISEIAKYSNGNLTIKGNSSINTIVAPVQIENFDRLEELLNSIKPILLKTKETLIIKYRGILPFLTIGLMIAVFVLKNKIIVGISGVILLTVLVYSFIEIQRSKNVDKKTKNRTWWLILVFAAIIGNMYLKIFGIQ